MNRTVAVVDIGTNTIILLVAEVREGGLFRVLHDEARVVRLGEGIHQTPLFLPEAMARAFAALSDFKTTADGLGCKRVIAVGTAGFRNARNADEFIARVARELGIEIDVIDGEHEADLVFKAAKADFADLSQPFLVLDIGGGSTEFIIEAADHPRFATSLPFGSVKLTENFLHGDPPTRSELVALDAYLTGELAVLPNIAPPSLVATAGTATTVAALVQELISYDPEKVHGSVVTVPQLANLMGKLESVPFSDRKKWPCLEPKRADVIVAGARILNAVCARFGVNEFRVSDRGLRYGVLLEEIRKNVG
jgi:exopolyphosphatase/guanosine-5'-triphosphate,3'-diphosphate pyrophosphatase